MMGRCATLLVVVALAITSNAEDVMPSAEDFDGLESTEDLVQAEESAGETHALTTPALRTARVGGARQWAASLPRAADGPPAWMLPARGGTTGRAWESGGAASSLPHAGLRVFVGLGGSPPVLRGERPPCLPACSCRRSGLSRSAGPVGAQSDQRGGGDAVDCITRQGRGPGRAHTAQ